jgi:hypothetical protein
LRNRRLVKPPERFQIDYACSSLHHEQKQSVAEKVRIVNRTVV